MKTMEGAFQCIGVRGTTIICYGQCMEWVGKVMMKLGKEKSQLMENLNAMWKLTLY